MFVKIGKEIFNLNCIEKITPPEGEVAEDSVYLLHFTSGNVKSIGVADGEKLLKILPNPGTELFRAIAFAPTIQRQHYP